MKKQWKQIMVFFCTAILFATVPCLGVLADELQETNIVLDFEDSESFDVALPVNEEIVSSGAIVVGDGVTAIVDSNTGDVVLYSSGGTLQQKWIDLLDINKTKITSIDIDDSSGPIYFPNYSGHMFEDCINLKTIDLSGVNTSKTKSFFGMFSGCNSLTDLNISSFDTSKATDMSLMFSNCVKLTSLDLSNFNTSSVTSMYGMFHTCKSLTYLNIDNFDTSNMSNMSSMFYDCNSLVELNVSSFDTSLITDMSFVFRGCESLTRLDLSNFDTTLVRRMDFMFSGCSSLISLDLSNFDTSLVTSMMDMFGNDFNRLNSLKELDLSSFDMSNVSHSVTNLLNYCQSLQLLRTPKSSPGKIRLSTKLYDDSGKRYTEIPSLSESVILAGKDYMAQAFGIINISKCTVILNPTNYTYNGESKCPDAVVTYGDISLIKETDFNLTYSNNINAGTATITVEGLGNYIGFQTVPFTIYKANPHLYFNEYTITKLTTDPDFDNTLTVISDGEVRFRSSNEEVAIVNSITGTVTIVSAGKAIIRAYTVGGTNYNDYSFVEYTLYVKEPALSPTPTPTPTDTPALNDMQFSDVQDPHHAYYKAIYWAADAGITKGYPDGTFGIDRSCTRGEMMMFLWRYAGKPAPKNVSKSPFKDVPKTHTFYKAILWGSQKGITKGYSDGTFGIDRNVSRGECMMFLWRLKGKPAPKAVAKAPFPDVPKSHVFYNAVLWGYQKKITTGFTSGKLKGKFGVNENCSRGQIVTFLYRAK